jgi:hypothetical protein
VLDAYGLPEFGGHLYRLGILPAFIMAPLDLAGSN